MELSNNVNESCGMGIWGIELDLRLRMLMNIDSVMRKTISLELLPRVVKENLLREDMP